MIHVTFAIILTILPIPIEVLAPVAFFVGLGLTSPKG